MGFAYFRRISTEVGDKMNFIVRDDGRILIECWRENVLKISRTVFI